MSISARKLAANRANAQKSTGPQSQESKDKAWPLRPLSRPLGRRPGRRLNLGHRQEAFLGGEFDAPFRGESSFG
jgi:hypothetical protein